MKKPDFMRSVSASLVLLTTLGFAQGQGTLDMGIQYNQPVQSFEQGGFKDGIGMYFGGWSGDLIKGKGPALQLGARADFSWNGNRHQNLTLYPNIPARLNVDNYTFGGHGAVRLIAPAPARLRPYIDGYLGGRLIGTSESLNLTQSNSDDNNLYSKWPYKAGGVSYGAGVGAQYWFNSCVALDLRGIYLDGPSAQYSQLSTVAFDNSVASYATSNSRASMVYFQVGITVNLSGNCMSSGSDCDCHCGGSSTGSSSGSSYNNRSGSRSSGRIYVPQGSGGSFRPSTGGPSRSVSPGPRISPSVTPRGKS